MAKILVIDDQQSTLLTIEGILSAKGHAVLTSTNTFDAMALITQQRFDLIITDIQMPRSNSGYELVQTLRKDKRWMRLPIILLSGRRALRDVQRGVKAGADDYMIKPVEPEVLLVKVETLLQKRAHEVVNIEEVPLEEGGAWSDDIRLVSINELGVIFTSRLSAKPGTAINIQSSLFDKIGIPAPRMSVVTAFLKGSGDHPYSVQANFENLSDEHLEILRAWLDKNQASRAS